MDLSALENKLRHAERISEAEALFLFQTPNVHALGRLAEYTRQRWNGNRAYYIVNRHINYSNVCIDNCSFCSFARKAGAADAFTHSLETMMEYAEQGAREGAREFHIVGGLHPRLPYDYYLDLLRSLKSRFPQIHLKAFTAVEISFFSRKFHKSIEQVLQDLIEAGLDSLPGGGAEMFSQRVRELICPNKDYVDEWLDVHRIAHRLGLPTNATMLYGHIERPEEIIEHLSYLRTLQDETKGFLIFIPLRYHPHNNRLGGESPTGLQDLRVHAVSRIFLDNFPHIKSYWTMLGVKAAQVMLNFGADDFDGTVGDEKIVHMAGAATPKSLPVSFIQRLIREAGREPMERDSWFHPISQGSFPSKSLSSFNDSDTVNLAIQHG